MDITTLGGDGLEWDAFVRSAKDGTPFHLTAWKRAVEEAFGYRAHYLLARHGGEIHGVLPLFEVPGLLGGRSLISVPYAVYGGLCAVDAETRRALVTAAAELAGQRRAAYVELRNQEEQGLALPVKDRYVTFAREISADDEANLAAIPRKQRRMVRQGAKHGLRAEFGEAHFDGFYDIYAESVRNLGSPVFPRRLLRGIMEAFDKECQLLTIWREDQMVAGVLTLLYEDRILPYYGGARREAFQYAVNDFMYWELMCHAARSGFRVFDFGRSRVGTGSYDFKRHWGFEPRPLPYQYVMVRAKSMPDMSPSNPRLHWAVETWKRLPLAVTNVIGPWLTRYTP